MKRQLLASLLGAVFALTGGTLLAVPNFIPSDPKLPTVFIAGDSTAASGGGWGAFAPAYFDLKRINVCNCAVSGTSSRTFIAGGTWGNLMEHVKAGDFVLIQFGHNDFSPVNEAESVPVSARRSRGTLPGLGEESKEIDNIITKKHEVIHTYGWYLRQMVKEVQAKGAQPILLSPTVHNAWKEGKISQGRFDDYRKWAEEQARQLGVPFLDVTRRLVEEYERRGQEQVKPLFPKDTVHTSAQGSDLVASVVVAGLRELKNQPLNVYLSEKGQAVSIPQNKPTQPAQ